MTAIACAPPAATSRTPAPVRHTRQVLVRGIDSLAAQTRFSRAHLGILIIDPARADTLYSLNAGRLFMPASNMKIVTAAVALAQLGPDFRFRTEFRATEPVVAGVLPGNLIVVGRGDPTVSDRMHGDAMIPLRAVAESLWALGIREISGGIASGGDAFPDSIYGYGWEWDDLATSSGAPVDELLYDEGMTRVPAVIGGRDTVISTATRNPTLTYLEMLARALRGRGIAVDSISAPADSAALALSRPLFVTWSPPLREILPIFLKPSQNQIGEVLLRTLGLERAGLGTADSGSAVLSRQLIEWGIDRDGFVAYDGSGLSRHNLLSPESIVRTLVAIQRDTAAPVFLASLPVAGVDGTLRRRMLGTPAAGNVRAKTGTIEFVRALSGYVTTASGRWLVFSMLSNHFTGPVSEVTKLQDDISELLASYNGP